MTTTKAKVATDPKRVSPTPRGHGRRKRGANLNSQRRLIAKAPIAERVVEAARSAVVACETALDAARWALREAQGNKTNQIQDLLARPEGATAKEIGNHTGWMEHTVRAMISRMRRDGVAIAGDKEGGRKTVYRIANTT